MKKTPLRILIGLVVVTVSIAAYTLWKVPQRFSPTHELIGEDLIEAFDVDLLEEVRIANSETEVVLRRKGNAFVVANRQDYPIDNVGELRALVDAIARFRVGLEIPADEKHYAEIGLLEPADKKQAEAHQEKRKKEGVEDPADPRGLLISMKGAGDKVFAKMVLGNSFGNTSDRQQSLILRNLTGHEGIWRILGTLTLRTGEATPGANDVRRGPLSDPKAWLSYKFIEVENIKSISLSAPNDKEFKAWTVTRETALGDFTTGDLKEDEEMDTSGTSSFKTLFEKLHIEDVLDPAEAEKKKDRENARQAVITTFDGFTYTFDLTPMKVEEEEGDDVPSTTFSNYIGTVKIEAKFQETRTKGESETAEQAKALDLAFATELDNLTFKLENEKPYEEHTFEFAQFSISSLNKARDQIVKAKAPPSPEGDTPPAGLPNGLPGSLPPGLIPGGARPSAVTPPVRVPPVENP